MVTGFGISELAGFAKTVCIGTRKLSAIRKFAMFLGIVIFPGSILAACAHETEMVDTMSEPESEARIIEQPSGLQISEKTVTLTGTRVTVGNAVQCAEIRTDDGQVHAVTGLTAAVAIGDRVTVTGKYGYPMTCSGRALISETVEIE